MNQVDEPPSTLALAKNDLPITLSMNACPVNEPSAPGAATFVLILYVMSGAN